MRWSDDRPDYDDPPSGRLAGFVAGLLVLLSFLAVAAALATGSSVGL